MSYDYDLFVIGSGSIGAATSYYAAQAGLKVLAFDTTHPPHTQGSHHGKTRIIRYAYAEGEKYVPMLLRARTLWKKVMHDSGEKLLQECGLLHIAPKASNFISRMQRSAKMFSLPVEFLEREEILQRWPMFKIPSGYIGIYEANAGFLYSEKAVTAYIRLAKQVNCQQLFQCTVNNLIPLSEGVEVTTSFGRFRGHKAVISTGTWIKFLLPQWPITAIRKVFTWYQANEDYSIDNHFPAFIIEAQDGCHYYGFPADKHGLKVGKHQGGQLITSPEQCQPFGNLESDRQEVSDFLQSFLPDIQVLLHGESCSYELSPDEDFILDQLTDQIMVITGLSGHGFKFSSVLGEIAMKFSQNSLTEFDLSPFSLKRFS
ncbi:putative sarcosine oxidase [Liberibacter crescens BT-1]|uniref:Putative sarcosine oxidase n=2 Tax=Liberibacter crescens TaxID=1273132 RepID=L0EST8_LIBCB|nr:N-methyl-L-tryptophan oxidase [Liberibacter crescens]AGA64579.1 putative sarcosine oxidase [Liberibacter crescens BT-1]AMC12713.1 N-methyltryptophan oxidase [Liberibacter crescens]